MATTQHSSCYSMWQAHSNITYSHTTKPLRHFGIEVDYDNPDFQTAFAYFSIWLTNTSELPWLFARADYKIGSAQHSSATETWAPVARPIMLALPFQPFPRYYSFLCSHHPCTTTGHSIPMVPELGNSLVARVAVAHPRAQSSTPVGSGFLVPHPGGLLLLKKSPEC